MTFDTVFLCQLFTFSLKWTRQQPVGVKLHEIWTNPHSDCKWQHPLKFLLLMKRKAYGRFLRPFSCTNIVWKRTFYFLTTCGFWDGVSLLASFLHSVKNIRGNTHLTSWCKTAWSLDKSRFWLQVTAPAKWKLSQAIRLYQHNLKDKILLFNDFWLLRRCIFVNQLFTFS